MTEEQANEILRRLAAIESKMDEIHHHLMPPSWTTLGCMELSENAVVVDIPHYARQDKNV